jgi:outer membrane biosynthesis protein TonB
MKYALTASIAVLAFLPWLPAGKLAAQETTAPFPFPRNMNTAMMKVTPTTKGGLVLSWDSSAIACDGGAVAASTWIAPHPQFASQKLMEFPVTVGFSIGADGRAADLRVIEGGYVEGTFEATFDAEAKTMRFNTKGVLESMTLRDLMPSLRASRFAADAPQTGCTITYTPRYEDAAEAGSETLAAIGAVPGAVLTAAQRDQLGGGDCNTVGWPAPLLRAYPDWRLITPQEGARKWGWIRFDIDEQGVPTNLGMIASTGDKDLNAEGLRAVRDSRMADGPRTACVTAWWSNPAIIPAPPAPDTSDFTDYRSCDAVRTWASKPKLTYPQAYNDRQIEGWAVLGFDIGADGVIGNVTVLAA